MNNKTYAIASKNVKDTLEAMNGNGMIDSYYLKYKDSETGILEYDILNDKYSFVANNEYDGMPPFPIIMINREIDDIQWDFVIRNWIDDRVIQENRPEVKEILKYLNLCYYDKWDICRRNLARSVEDHFWITKDNNIDYRNVSFRYSLLEGSDSEYQAPFSMISYPSPVVRVAKKLGLE